VEEDRDSREHFARLTPSRDTHWQTSSYASGSTSAVFVDKNGDSIPFYVQQGSKWRNDCLRLVKRHGGIIVSDIPQATYVVIFPQVENSYVRLQEAIAEGKAAVRSAFVQECVNTGRLLPAKAFSLDGAEMRDRRGRPVLVDLKEVQAETKSGQCKTTKEATRASPPSMVGETTGGSSARRPVVSPEDEEQDEEDEEADDNYEEVIEGPPLRAHRQMTGSHSDSVSPSPPPPREVERFAKGRNRFTQAELAYCRNHVRRLMRRNPSISFIEIASVLADKVT
jgi:hypothetical protein